MDFRKGFLALMGAATLLILAACGGQQAQTSGQTVSGKLVDICNQPLAYTTVMVPGHDPVLTGADGTFTIENVQTPYDLIVNNATLAPRGMYMRGPELSLLVYEGLTKADPYLMVIPTRGSTTGSCAEASIEGNITPANENDDYATAFVLPPYVDYDEPWYDSGTSTVSYSMDLEYDPAVAGTATLLGVGWRRDADNKVQFYGADEQEITLTSSGGDLGTKNLDLTQNELGNRDLEVSVQLPSLMNLYKVYHYLTLNGVNLPIETESVSPEDNQTTFTLTGPTGAGLGSLVSAQARYGGGLIKSLAGSAPLDLSDMEGRVWVWQRVDNGTNNASVTLNFPDPVIPVTPLNGSTIDPANTTFHWVGPNDHPLYNVAFIMLSEYGPDSMIDVVTNSDEIHIPDLSSLGLTFDNSIEGVWFLSAVHGQNLPDTVDDLASSDSAQYLPSFYASDIAPTESGYSFTAFAGWFMFPNGNNVPE